MTKLLGIDILKGYLGCFGAKIVGFTTGGIGGISSIEGISSVGKGEDGNIILNVPILYSIAGAWQGKLIMPLASNFCFATRQPIITRVWNDQIKRQIKNVDVSLKIAPTLSATVLMEYMGMDTSGLNNILNGNNEISIDLNNVNPFLLLVSTMLAQRQRTSTTYMNIGDMYYTWKLQTANIIEEDLFLTKYSIDYETGDVLLNLTTYVAPSIRGQVEPSLYQSLQAGQGSS